MLSIIVVQYGYTAVMYASSNGHLPVVQYLVQQGADIHMQDKVKILYRDPNMFPM